MFFRGRNCELLNTTSYVRSLAPSSSPVRFHPFLLSRSITVSPLFCQTKQVCSSSWSNGCLEAPTGIKRTGIFRTSLFIAMKYQVCTLESLFEMALGLLLWLWKSLPATILTEVVQEDVQLAKLHAGPWRPTLHFGPKGLLRKAQAPKHCADYRHRVKIVKWKIMENLWRFQWVKNHRPVHHPNPSKTPPSALRFGKRRWTLTSYRTGFRGQFKDPP